MSLHSKISEALHKVAKESSMRHDRFNEHGRFGADAKKNEKKEPKETHSLKDVDEDNDIWAKRHRTAVTNRSENQRGRSTEHSKKHPGFKAVQGKIEKEGYSSKIAGAILASRTRHASATAKHSNPRLKRV